MYQKTQVFYIGRKQYTYIYDVYDPYRKIGSNKKINSGSSQNVQNVTYDYVERYDLTEFAPKNRFKSITPNIRGDGLYDSANKEIKSSQTYLSDCTQLTRDMSDFYRYLMSESGQNNYALNQYLEGIDIDCTFSYFSTNFNAPGLTQDDKEAFLSHHITFVKNALDMCMYTRIRIESFTNSIFNTININHRNKPFIVEKNIGDHPFWV